MTAIEAGPFTGEASDLLEETARVVIPPLRSAVFSLCPHISTVAGYHFGWIDKNGNAVTERGGKLLRPTIALAAAGMISGDSPRRSANSEMSCTGFLAASVAIELVHNYSLIHDDVIDRDDLRHGRPTVWRVFGSARAILAGDALASLATEVLAKVDSAYGLRAIGELTSAVGRMVAGQAQDIALEQHSIPPRALRSLSGGTELVSWASKGIDGYVSAYLEMAAAKTGALFGCAAVLPALLSGLEEGECEALRSFGTNAGVAFQAIDDVLGIWGDPEVTGKPLYSDIFSRKLSLPVALVLSGAGDSKDKLRSIYGLPSIGPKAASEAARVIEDAGAKEQAYRLADEYMNLALSDLKRTDCTPRGRAALGEIAGFMARRDR